MLMQLLVNYLNLFNWVMMISAKASIFVILLLGVKFALRSKLGVRFHYLLWVVLLIGLLLPWTPTSSVSVYNFLDFSKLQQGAATIFKSPYQPYFEMQKTQTHLDKTLGVINTDSKALSTAATQISSNSLPIIIQLMYLDWFCGVLLVSILTIISNKQFAAKIGNNLITDDRILSNFNSLKLKLKIKAEIPLITTRHVKSPSLFGLFHPRILLPLGFEQTFNLEQINYILLHELVHFKRKDLWINWLAQVLVTIHWFNPLLWYAFFQMKEDQETACDAIVISRFAPEQSNDYAHTLIKLAETYSSVPALTCMASLGGSKTLIKKRLILISKPKKTSVSWLLLSVAVIGLIAFSTFTSPKVSAEPLYNQNTNNNEQIEGPSKAIASSSGIIIEDITGSTYKGKVMLIKDSKRVNLAMTKNIGISGERVSDLVKDTGAIAGINAGGFSDPDGKGNGAFPEGLVMHEGKVVYNNVGDKNVNVAGFDEQGKLVIGSMTAKQLQESNMREAVTFKPNLIVKGKVVIDKDGGWGIAPRTGIGQMADGTVILVVIDGRQATWSLGATLRDLAEVFADYHAVTAVNLDGGSSSEMFFQGKVQNRLGNVFGERYLPTAFVVN
ncbi:M56 family metallopeptidase [Desulfosporosinus sp. SYSU MS00001]|uniref:M56 family metallopeptidase n=1 Tax=Desulfosporosinus sp. SYSU MS00001 TaxID=3416284 RepID=UPI003CEA3405